MVALLESQALVMIKIWLFEHKFQHRNFGQLRIVWAVKLASKLWINLSAFCLHFELKLKREGRNLKSFSK